MQPHVEQLFSEHYQALLKNDVLVYAEKCNFIESFYILRLVDKCNQFNA